MSAACISLLLCLGLLLSAAAAASVNLVKVTSTKHTRSAECALSRSALPWTTYVYRRTSAKSHAHRAHSLVRRRRTSEVAQWAMSATVDLKPFIYIYDLPPEYNQAFKQLPAGWHSEQYDCALPCNDPACDEALHRLTRKGRLRTLPLMVTICQVVREFG